MTGLEALQSVQFVTRKGKRFAVLNADDWEGFPLRKDYVFPREYHGIPASVELDWQQQPDYPK